MHHLTVGILNINQAQLTIDVLANLARLPDDVWSVQLILVDNGSSAEQLQELTTWFSENSGSFAEVLFISAFRNLGADGGRNQILKLATGSRFLFLDNDVILPEDNGWLETLWRRMDENPEIGIVGPMLVFADYPDIVQATGIGLTDRGRVGYLNRAEAVEAITPDPVEVVASPAACWLIRKEAQQQIGLFPTDYYPMQYEDVDYCIQFVQAGWKILCDPTIKIQHIENVTTRNLDDHPYARVSVKHARQFRQKWAHVLPQLATITDNDIYWNPIPRGDNG